MRKTVSTAALVVAALAPAALAQDIYRTGGESPFTAPTSRPPAIQTRSNVSSGSRYTADIEQIKHMTLESEPAFFERLERQAKIEGPSGARTLLVEAKQGLMNVRRKLSPAGIDELFRADEELARTDIMFTAVERNLRAVRTELQQFQEQSTPRARAIAAGRQDAAPLYSELRRLIKAAHGELKSVRNSYNDVERNAADARLKVEKGAATFADLTKDIDGVAKSMLAVQQQTTDLMSDLEVIWRANFPDCATAATRARAAGPGTSLALLNQAAVAADVLDVAIAHLAALRDGIKKLDAALIAAMLHAEALDAPSNPAFDGVRKLHAKADKLIDIADAKLAETRNRLTKDGPTESEICSHCGKEFGRVTKVLDPAEACARADEPMRQAEQTIREAREMAEQMLARLEAAEPADADAEDRRTKARLELHNPANRANPGVITGLTLAMERGKEFRNQQFDFYPSETYGPPAEPLPPRNFPPTVAYYAARQTWHYSDYFEDIALERYGHHHGCLQPFVSSAKFLADLALVPYNMTAHPPYEKQYELGLYRPGDDVPHLIYVPEWNCHAACVQAGVWTGLLFVP